jgi:hypothetical protein
VRNRVFFPQEALDLWTADDRVDMSAEELVLKSEGRKFKVVEAVYVLREVTGTPDPNELVGKVKSRAYLAELGAELLEGSMIIGENAYDVVQGFVGAPATSFEEHKKETSSTAGSDEDVLRQFAAGA